jgi:putative SOS response-associated peptidase YedK
MEIKDGAVVYRSFTIMTTEANQIVGKVHDSKFRMPVILDKNSEAFWLSKDVPASDLLSLCKPYPDDQMEAYQVGTEVNSTVIKGIINNRPELMLPINSQ